MVAGGGRSKEGGDDGASGRAELVSDRWGKEEGGDDDRAHNQINIWALLWRTVRRSLADRPQFPGCYTASLRQRGSLCGTSWSFQPVTIEI